jgi:hypothetical protein
MSARDLQGNEIGNVKPWHQPHNEECLNNQDVYKNCTCKRVRQAKGYKVVRVNQRNLPSHSMKNQIVLEIWPDGQLRLREAKRKTYYETTAADVYYQLMLAKARHEAWMKRKARKEARKARRAA